MKKALLWVGLMAVGLLLVCTVLGLLLPNARWSVERSVEVAAPPAAIHPFVEDFRAWEAWAARDAERDPTRKVSYSGAAKGVGASFSWVGDELGRGTITITESDPERGVWFDEMIESDAINARGSITYTAAQGGTRVTWTDEGELPPLVGQLLEGSIEQRLGDHFAAGLEQLRRLVEQGTAK